MENRIFYLIKAYIEKYHMIEPGDIIAAGVSGGADSVCLFLILAELMKEMDFRLTAVHVNHGMRAEAVRDAEYVEKLCRERSIPFFLVEEDVKAYARKEKLSGEEAGRRIRYKAFEAVLKQYAEKGALQGKIAVAHNANDRAETMLFHLFRGTGLAGAGGIKPIRNNIIRPLLCLQREEIEEYLLEKQISYCIDHTNLEDTYTRNRIRNHILPYAEKEICQGAVSHMCSAADILLETEGYIKGQRKKAYAGCVLTEDENRIVLDVKRIRAEVPFIRKQIILEALERLTGHCRNITSLHISAIEGLLNKGGTKQTVLPYGLIITKEYDRLIMTGKPEVLIHKRDEGELPAELPAEIQVPEVLDEGVGYVIEIPGLGSVEVTRYLKENYGNNTDIHWKKLEKYKHIPEKSCTKWFDYDKITKSLIFRRRKTGDYLTINKNMSRKTLKDYMIGEKIPKHQRESIYVLSNGSHILWVPGFRVSEYYKITEETKSILKVQLRGGL